MTSQTKAHTRKVFDCVHADTCLPDFWSGHHLPYLQIPVYPGMSGPEIRQSLLSELSERAVGGSSTDAMMLTDSPLADENRKYADMIYAAAVAAIRRMRLAKPRQRRFFLDVSEPVDDCDATVYAFFVFFELD